MHPQVNSRARVVLGALRWLAASLVLASVFSLYGQADFLVQMANQFWTCF